MKKIQNLFITALSLIFFVYRGFAKKKIDPKKFVIINPTGNIGDMVCTTPVFAAIKKQYPNATVIVVGVEKNRVMLEHNPHVDMYVVCGGGVWSLIRTLRAHNIDAGVVINLSALDLAILFLAGVQKISCFSFGTTEKKYESRSYRLLKWVAHQTVYEPGKYVPQQVLHLLRPFNIHAEHEQKCLGLHPEVVNKLTRELLSQNIHITEKILAVAPGAGADYKRWPAERFAAIANYLYNMQHMPVMVVGGPSDTSAVQAFIAALDTKVRLWNPGPQSMEDLKGTLSIATLVLGNDSGAIHVGEALGTMTLTVAGATDVTEHMMENDRHRIVKGVGEGILYQSYIGDEAKIDTSLAKKQMESVSVDTVTEVASALLNQRNSQFE